jgi:hypothetical protein
VEQLTAYAVPLDFTDDNLLRLFIIVNSEVYKPCHARLADDLGQIGRLALQGQRLNIVAEEVGGGGALAAQKTGLLAQYFSSVCL